MGDLVVTILILVGVVAVTTVLFGGWMIVSLLRGTWRLINRGSDHPIGSLSSERSCGNAGCRTTNPPQARFCRRCGAALEHGTRSVAIEENPELRIDEREIEDSVVIMTVFTGPISSEQSARGFLPADDLVRRLCSSVAGPASGAFAAAFQVLISFGLLPLILWPTRWAAFADAERADLLELMSRWRSRVSPTDARQLDKIARRFRPRPMSMVLPWLAAGFIGVMMIVLMAQGTPVSSLTKLTFAHVHHYRAQDAWVVSDSGRAFDAQTQLGYWQEDPAAELRWEIQTHLFQFWLVGLIFGYAVHWHAVRSHARAVGSLVNWSNRLATANGFPMIRNDTQDNGLGPVWIVLGVVLCSLNAWWGIPLVLGGAMQRQYSRKSSLRIRTALGCQLRDGFALVASNVRLSRFCSGNHCGGRLPDAANFCPRCGAAAIARAVDRV